MTRTKKSSTKTSLKAVVCDDDPVSREVARAVLEKNGYQVSASVDSAMDAIQVALICQPDVVVLDLALPHMSGEAAIPAIRSAAPDCVIVVCSAFPATGALKNGATLAVAKGSTQALGAMLRALAAQAPRANRTVAS